MAEPALRVKRKFPTVIAPPPESRRERLWRRLRPKIRRPSRTALVMTLLAISCVACAICGFLISNVVGFGVIGIQTFVLAVLLGWEPRPPMPPEVH